MNATATVEDLGETHKQDQQGELASDRQSRAVMYPIGSLIPSHPSLTDPAAA